MFKVARVLAQPGRASTSTETGSVFHSGGAPRAGIWSIAYYFPGRLHRGVGGSSGDARGGALGRLGVGGLGGQSGGTGEGEVPVI